MFLVLADCRLVKPLRSCRGDGAACVLCVGERERVEQTDTLLVLKASGFQISLFLRLPLNQCGQECCSSVRLTLPHLRSFLHLLRSSLGDSWRKTLFENTIAVVCFFFPFCLPSSFFPPPLSFSPFPPSVFLFTRSHLSNPTPLRLPLFFLQLEVRDGFRNTD